MSNIRDNSIIIATNNEGKVSEIKYYLKDFNFKIYYLKDFKNVPEIVEDGKDFRENAIKKAKIISETFNKLSLADDSGLEVDFLGGKPGVFSARYSGIDATDKSNRVKLLSELSQVKDLKDRSARFVCHLVLWDPIKGLIFETDGVCEGNIGFKEVGDGGFGYDSIFIPKGFDKTMAQLSKDEKNEISHRGKALKNFVKFLLENY
jgi:XTP/dITP diphosphohydrolase